MKTHPLAMAFDLDGTLAESKQPMTSEMGALLTQLLAKIPVAVMSGAGFPQFEKQFLSALPKKTTYERLYIFPENASQCFLYADGEWKSHYNHDFSEADKVSILSTLSHALEEVGLKDTPETVWGERIEDRGSQISFSPLGQQAPLIAKKDWHQKNNRTRIKLHDLLEHELPNFSVAIGGITTIDITRKGINKAYGVETFSKLITIPISDILYVGDALEPGGNDAVVVKTGVPTHQVRSPKATAECITSVLSHL